MTDTSYEELPYVKYAFSQTHPNHIAAIGQLFGMRPCPPSQSRILELGCAHGSNIAPMAVALPSAEFVGVDLSASQIREGKATLKAAGVANVTLKQADIMEIDADWGKFDYIIAHGLHSWIPVEVQAKLMQICSANLAPDGIAYISYNCNPGWKTRSMVRDMILFHTAGVKSALDKVRHARGLLDYLAAGTTQNTPYAAALKREAEAIRKGDDSYIYHEFLEANNHPVYFYEMMAKAQSQGLMYLAESPIRSMFDTDFDANTVATLNQLGSGNILNVEQYMDFLRNRVFRQTLFVHRNLKLSRNLDWHNLAPVRIQFRQEITAAEHDITSHDRVEYTELSTNIKFAVTEPLIKAALQILRENAPQCVSFTELVDRARGMAKQEHPHTQAEEMIATHIFRLLSMGLADLAAEPWRCAAEVPDRPKASALARHQAQLRDPIVTLRHQHTDRNPNILWYLLQLLDGQHTLDELATELANEASTGRFQLKRDGQVITAPSRLLELVRADLPMHLEHLRQMALLLAA